MRIAGIGCCLLDSVYNGFDIKSDKVQKLMSRKNGDGGLQEGKLGFLDDLLKVSGLDYDTLNQILTNGRDPVTMNLGGPSVVAMVQAAQMLEMMDDVSVYFQGVIAKDKSGVKILDVLSKTPLKYDLKLADGEHSPGTIVLAGNGERTFVNRIGAAIKMTPELIDENFFKSDIVLCGGTALVPNIHDNLSSILRRVKANGGITVVGTVFDFRNEKKNPDKPWPLVQAENWKDIDVLVVDAEEAIRISGKESLEAAAAFFENRVQSFIITQGSRSIWVWASNGTAFKSHKLEKLPVSAYIDELLAKNPELKHDTTGCGDNFVGGVLTSIAKQKEKDSKSKLDIVDLCAWGAASGGFTLLYDGGTYIEKEKGEKAKKIQPIVEAYFKQISY